MTERQHNYVAFAGHTRIAAGALADVARGVRVALDGGEAAPIAVFDTSTSAPVDLDLRGTPDEVADRTREQEEARVAKAGSTASKPGPGRPKLGVLAREVTLLPRHWDWLGAQPGGASVTLRKLVDAARKQGHESERIRRTQDVTHRFMYAVAGDLPGFEEAARALYAWDREGLERRIEAWPEDVAGHVRTLVDRS